MQIRFHCDSAMIPYNGGMKNTIKSGLTFILLLITVLSYSQELQILHTNDIHGAIFSAELEEKGGMDKVASYIKRQRELRQEFLFLDAGDFLDKGNYIDRLSRGKLIHQLLSELEYDAVTIGNHDLKEISPRQKYIPTLQNLQACKVPVISCNINNRSTGKLITEPYILKEMNGVRIGIIGAVYPMPLSETSFFEVIDPQEPIIQCIEELETEHQADMIILLIHQSLRYTKELIRKLPHVDLVIAGHDHRKTAKPIKVKSTWLVEAGDYAELIGHGHYYYDRAHDMLLLENYQLAEMDQEFSDPEFVRAVRKKIRKINKENNTVIAVSDKDFSSRKQLLRWTSKARLNKLKCDYVIVSESDASQSYPPGNIRPVDVFRKYDYENNLYLMEVSGKELKKIRKTILNKPKKQNHLFPGNHKIIKEQNYTIAIDSWITDHWDWYFETPKPEIIRNAGSNVEMEIDYLRSLKRLK